MCFPSRNILFSIFIIQVFSSAGGDQLVVDNLRGSDLQSPGDGQRFQAPYRTIQRAIDHAVSGDTIAIRETGEPYRECVSINTNNNLGTPDFPLIIEGNGVTLDGTRGLGILDWDLIGNDVFELKVPSPGYVKILAAPDQPIPENRGHVSNLGSLKPFQYARSSGTVYFKARRGDRPVAYGLRVSSEQTGLTLYDVSNIVIRDLKVDGYRLDGINCHDLVENVTLENVTLTNNGRSGLSIGGASRVQCVDSSASGNGESQVRTEGQSTLELFNVKVVAGDAKAIDRAGGQVIEKR